MTGPAHAPIPGTSRAMEILLAISRNGRGLDRPHSLIVPLIVVFMIGLTAPGSMIQIKSNWLRSP